MCYLHFMFLYTCIGTFSKWSFPMHIFCAPQFHIYFTSKKIPIFHLFLWIKTSGFFMSLSVYCLLFVSHMEGISYLLESLLPFSSLKFYYIIFEMEESELPAVFKVNKYPTLILWHNICFCRSCFYSFYNSQHLLLSYLQPLCTKLTFRTIYYKLNFSFLVVKFNLEPMHFIHEFKTLSSHLHLSSQNFIFHFITWLT